MRFTIGCVGLLLAFTALEAPLHPQDPRPGPEPEEMLEGAFLEVVETAVARAEKTIEDPSLTSPARRTDLQAILAARRTETRAELEIGFELREEPEQPSELKASLKLGGPVSKEDQEPELASLEGLGNQVTLGAGVRFLQMKPEEIREVAREAIEGQSAQIPDLMEETWRELHPGQPTPDALALEDLGTRGREIVLEDLLGNARRGTWFFATEAAYAAPETFKFVDPDTLEQLEEEHDGWTASLTAGWLPVISARPYVGLTYRYEDGHKAQGKRQVCSPFGPEGSLACDNLVIGAPNALRKHLIQLETRRYFSKATAAIGLRLTHDLENDVSGAELPLWALRDPSGLLNGGVAVGWRSDTEDWTFSAFVGTPFGQDGP